MGVAYQYAINQVLGLQFEPFTLTTGGKCYTWNPPRVVITSCQAVRPLSWWLFQVFVRVN